MATIPQTGGRVKTDVFPSGKPGVYDAPPPPKSTGVKVVTFDDNQFTIPADKEIASVKTFRTPNGATYLVPVYTDGTNAQSDYENILNTQPEFGGNRVPQAFTLFTPKSTGGGGGGGGGGDTGAKTYTAPDGKIFTNLNDYNAYISQTQQAEKTRQGQSAYDLLYQQFNAMGLGALVDPLKSFITEGLSPAEFTLRLRETDAYKKRFAANAARINKGLRALSEAEYVGLEDQYQSVMRNYGLPASYYARGDMGRQEGFEKFIGFDVSPAELEDRIQTAYNRVINAAPEVSQALKTFYPDITNSDILAYSLDPEKALTEIRRKVTAAEIGGAALGAGLATDVARAEQLGRYGITAQQAQQGYQAIAGGLERGRQLSGLYQQPEYTQKTAEQEVFNLAGGTEAARERRKLTKLEQATFGGQTGMTGGALARDRAGTF
jgi:hypothetical protein